LTPLPLWVAKPVLVSGFSARYVLVTFRLFDSNNNTLIYTGRLLCRCRYR
jgi:hypothetical protein